jgi:type IV pilus assembly protein PilE
MQHPAPLQGLAPSSRAGRSGFSLIELLLVVALVGIVSTVAIPNYQKHVLRSRRSEAQAFLSAAAQAQERYRSNAPSYADSLDLLGLAPCSGNYCYELKPSSAPPFLAGYEIHAVPLARGPQAADRDCADMYIQLQAGQLSYRDRNPISTATGAACWPR